MAGYYNCSECGMPTSNRGLCVVCLAATKQLEVFNRQDQARQRAAEAQEQLQRAARAEIEEKRRDGQTRIQNLIEDPLGFMDSITCLISSFKGFSQGGIEGVKAEYIVKSVAIKMDNWIETIARGARKSWFSLTANLKMAGRPVDADAATAWFTNFCAQKPMTSPTNMSPEGIQIWITKELNIYMSDKWDKKAK